MEENLAIAEAMKPQSLERAPFLENSKITENDPLPYYFYGSTAIKQEILEVKKDMNVNNPSEAINGVLSIDREIRKLIKIKLLNKLILLLITHLWQKIINLKFFLMILIILNFHMKEIPIT